jgi:hypothetical protein
MKFFAWIKRMFRSLKALGQKFVTPSITIVEGLKKFVEGPLAPILTIIIPGTLDDRIVQKAKEYLPKILKSLRIADECLSLEKPEDIVACAVKNLKKYEPDALDATYHSVAAMLAVYLSDKKLSWSEAVSLTEYIYKNEKK